MEQVLVFRVVSGIQKSKDPIQITLGPGYQEGDGGWGWIRRDFCESGLAVWEEIRVGPAMGG